jgi:hypothetical protein
MNTATKLGLYVLGLAGVFGVAAGVGDLAGPVGRTVADVRDHTSGGNGGHGGSGGDGGHRDGPPAAAGPTGAEAARFPGGLRISQDGYTLVPRTTTVMPGERSDFRFTITGPDGRPVTRYIPLHGKKLHLIVARRDLSGHQHLHPAEVGGGVWSVPLTLPDAGVYRMFTDVRPEGAREDLTLGADLTAPGDLRPAALPGAEPVARVDGYEVTLTGALEPGRTSRLTLSVRKGGVPVTDLQPYLEAYGHLVALRAGDLAYLHVHPDGKPGDGRTTAGPGITFFAEVPSSGTYRLYLDFKHEGQVRTAEFTAVAPAPGGTAAPPGGTEGGGASDDPHAPGDDDDHAHEEGR